jgi:hypothetical protein
VLSYVVYQFKPFDIEYLLNLDLFELYHDFK